MEWIREVTDEDFEKEVVERSAEVTVVVDFWAEWCGPCRVLTPVLERLAAEAKGSFVLAKMNVDRSPRHAQAFGIRGIPTVIAFRNGQIAGEFSGALPEEAVRQFLKKISPSEADALFEQAEAIRDSDPSGAEDLYRRAIEADRGHQGAQVGLAELLVSRGEISEAAPLVEGLVAGGPFSERVERVQSELRIRERRPESSEAELRRKLEGDGARGPVLLELGKLLASERRFPEALEALLGAAGESSELAQQAKELMVEIFHLVGVRSPLADEYRTKLSRLLY